jgi:predicted O-methyltransferase YrrM
VGWYGVTIFLSAFLLFQVQPLMAKFILPWFGGGAGIWTACMVFFQCTLLVGYAYAHLLSNSLPLNRQALIHIIVLCLSIMLLPITPEASWKPADADSPTLDILLLLLVNVGVPFAVLSATVPLLSRWFSLSHPQRSPYRLYALSNTGSLLALLSYPFIIEPNWGLTAQAMNWSLAYGVFVLLCCWCAFRIRKIKQAVILTDLAQGNGTQSADESVRSGEVDRAPGKIDTVLWLVLSTTASVMLLASTHRLSHDVAVIPLMWIAPLALYLLSFILCFDHGWWYKRWLFIPLLVVSAFFVVSLMIWQGLAQIEGKIIAYLVLLFAVCMVCHGELVRIKPSARFLTRFYLVVATGGALGGILVAVIAPLILDDFWEYQFGLIAACLLAMLCVYLDRKRQPRTISTRVLVATRIVWGVCMVLLVILAVGLTGTVRKDLREYSEMSRNFYDVVRIKDSAKLRVMVSGRVDHGTQFVKPALRRIATTYYGRESGIGIAIQETRRLRQLESNNIKTGLRIGAIGLGTGTMAALTEPGDEIRFYEINPDVYRLADKYFAYLSDTKADVEVVFGDARLSLEREAQNGELQQFDVLAVDAFTSDAVPLHLLTREAMDLYFSHLAPHGLLAIHVSNNYVNLSAVVRGLANKTGRHAVRIYTPRSARSNTDRALWVIVTRDSSFLESELVQATATPWTEHESLPIVWTDDYASLWQAIVAEKDHTYGRYETAPNGGTFVIDEAGLLTYSGYLRLLEICRLLYHQTGGSRALMVVTANKMPEQDGRDLSFEEYSQQLYNEYKLNVPGEVEGIMILFSVAHGKASIRFDNFWSDSLNTQIHHQFSEAIKGGVSGKNLSEHLVPGVEAIDRLVRQTYQAEFGG